MVFDRDARALLGALADVVLPLHQWAQSGRNDESELRPSQLGVIEFIEANIASPMSARNEKWATRIQSIESSPLQFSPHEQAVYWRTKRGLDALPTFGIALSKNSPRHIAQFYTGFLDALAAYARPRLGGPGPWADDKVKSVADDLRTKEIPNWPRDLIKPAECMVMFTNDVAAALMAMTNVGSPTPFALLVSLKQGRRVGNRFTVKDVAEATASFKAILDKKMGA